MARSDRESVLDYKAPSGSFSWPAPVSRNWQAGPASGVRHKIFVIGKNTLTQISLRR